MGLSISALPGHIQPRVEIQPRVDIQPRLDIKPRVDIHTASSDIQLFGGFPGLEALDNEKRV